MFIVLSILVISPVVAIQRPELSINGIAVNLEENPSVSASVRGNGDTIEHVYQLSAPIKTDEYEIVYLTVTYKEDPFISYSAAVIDTGVPSTFNFTFNSPMNPLVAGPNLVRSSMSLSATDGGNDGVNVTALAPPVSIPVDSDGITEMQVTTVSDGSVQNNIGLDLGGPGQTFPASSQSVVWGPFNEGPVTGPVSGTGWNNLQLDINFQGSGGGDVYTLSGRSDVIVPTKIGVVRNSNTWLLDASGNGAYGAGDLAYVFGKAGDAYITGNWNTDGKTEIGVVRNNNTWFLDASGNGAYGAGDLAYVFGKAGDVYVTGDWNTDGKTEIGVVRNGNTWFLDNSGNGTYGAGDLAYVFGKAGDVYVTGDWNNDGKTEIGVVRNNNTWLLDAFRERNVWSR